METTASANAQRADGKVQLNKAVMTLQNASGGSPTYHLLITRDVIKVFDQALRFAAYRDLYTAINVSNECDDLLKVPFPPTLAKSSLGLKLTSEELRERFEILNTWFQALLQNFNDFSPSSRVAICKFLDVPEASIELVVPSPVADDEESGGPGGSQKGIFSSLLNRKKSAKAGTQSEIDDNASVISAAKGGPRAPTVTAEPPRPEVPQMTVYVSRGSVISGHPTYELNISYAANQRPFVLSKEFKHYRKLMEDLRALGVGYVETGDESGGGGTEKASRRSSLTRPSEAPGFNMPILTPLDAPFPKTHSKSALGISLSEEDLRDRCLGLDTWMRSVAENYFLFDVEAKKRFNTFLGYSEDFPDEVLYLIIERLNVEGSVKSVSKSARRGSGQTPSSSSGTAAAAPALTAAAVAAASASAQAQAQAQAQPAAAAQSSPPAQQPSNDRDSIAVSEYDANISFNRKVRTDTKFQANEISITSEEQGGHAVYVLTVTRDGLAKARLTHRFAPYRDLHGSVASDETVKRCVAFPETLKKSAFGVKLSPKELDIRRTKLENWWIDILDNFDDLSEETKHSVSEFLTVPVALLRLSTPAPPPPPAAPKSMMGRVLNKTMLSPTVEEGSQGSDDQDNGEWEDINGKKPPAGCCVIS